MKPHMGIGGDMTDEELGETASEPCPPGVDERLWSMLADFKDVLENPWPGASTVATYRAKVVFAMDDLRAGRWKP